MDYWKILSTDPTMAKTRVAVEKISPLPKQLDPKVNVCMFSPQPNANLLRFQCALAEKAQQAVFLTAAFGINLGLQKVFTETKQEVYCLLESRRGLSSEFLKLEKLKKIK